MYCIIIVYFNRNSLMVIKDETQESLAGPVNSAENMEYGKVKFWKQKNEPSTPKTNALQNLLSCFSKPSKPRCVIAYVIKIRIKAFVYTLVAVLGRQKINQGLLSNVFKNQIIAFVHTFAQPF